MADQKDIGLCTCPGCEWAYYLCLDKSRCEQCQATADDQDSATRFVFVYDAYVNITARTKAEADEKLAALEATIEQLGPSLSVMDAWGQEDAETGEEIRPVG